MRIILFIIGILSTILAFIGIFLPILPTTPLLLLALYCFSKSSKTFEVWLINTKMYKNYLEEFIEYKAMKFNKKIIILGFATLMMIFPIFILKSYIIKFIMILLLAYAYYYFIFNIKTIN